eukprot:SAG11_NODE_18090_length_500_cov_0.897756_1_plen_78_part_00
MATELLLDDDVAVECLKLLVENEGAMRKLVENLVRELPQIQSTEASSKIWLLSKINAKSRTLWLHIEDDFNLSIVTF